MFPEVMIANVNDGMDKKDGSMAGVFELGKVQYWDFESSVRGRLR